MVEPSYTLHGHTRSMSSLASTIVPFYFESQETNPTLTRASIEVMPPDIPDELRIPLPPSAASSDHGEDDNPVEPTDNPSGWRNNSDVEHGGKWFPGMDLIQDTASDKDTKMDTHSSGHTLAGIGPDVTDDNSNPEPVSLGELTATLRREEFETSRFQMLEFRVKSLLRQSGVYRRLLPVHSHLYRLMVDRFLHGNTTAFASMYSQMIGLQERINTARYDKPAWDYSLSKHLSKPASSETINSWTQTLSPESLESLIRLIRHIRTEPGFLAERIGKLSSSQLYDLAQPYRTPSTTGSIMSATTLYSKFDLRSQWNGKPKSKDSIDVLTTMQHDPLSVLLHGLFAASSGPGSQESQRQLDIWATVCAQVIVHGKTGSDEFCTAILNSFAALEPWTLEPQLELLLLDSLRSGAFILEGPQHQPVNFTQPAELHNAKIAVATSEFFAKNVERILELITQGPPYLGVPQHCLSLIRAILGKIADPGKRAKAKNFFVSRWYCTIFLSDAITYPETHGMMMDCYISDSARKSVLQELSNRLQKHFFDSLSPWKQPAPVSASVKSRIQKLLDMFDPLEPDTRQASSTTLDQTGKNFLMLSPQDVLAIAKALYPDHALEDTVEFAETSIPSTASSVTGSSTMTSGTDGGRTNTSSSLAVSISGTSMTSETLSCNLTTGTAENSGIGARIVVDDTTSLLQRVERTQTNCIPAPTKVLIHELTKLVDRDTSDPNSLVNRDEPGFFYIYENGNGLSLSPLSPKIDVRNSDTLGEDNTDGNNLFALNLDDLSSLSECLTLIARDPGMDYRIVATSTRTGLEDCFYTNICAAEARYDFQSAHFWWRGLQAVRRTTSQSLESVIQSMAETSKRKIESEIRLSNLYESWLFALGSRQVVHDQELERQITRSKALRDKMWFASEVRHSSTYEDALNVIRALKAMSKTTQSKATGVTAWARQRLRNSLGSDRAQAQTLEALAAHKDHGGPGKLSDKQVELTSRWLTRQSIENFCTGEERIHRFALEVQKCTNRLVGETLLDSPVLWSSKLYQQEKQGLGRDNGSAGLQGIYDQDFGRRDPMNRPPGLHDSGFMNGSGSGPQWAHAGFPHSMNEPRGPPYPPRNGTSLHIDSPRDLLVTTWASQDMDIATTLPRGWRAPPSPISPTSPMSVRRLSNSTSSAKGRFLERLKRTVRSLLLSDLGFTLWNDGSETDRWVSNALLEDQMNITTRPRSISVALQNTVQNLELNEHENKSSPTLRPIFGPADIPEAGRSREVDSESHPPLPCNTLGLQESQPSFHYIEGYKKLLSKFTLSCDPHSKLKALYDLTRLAAASQISEPEVRDHRNDSPPENRQQAASAQNNSGIRGVGVPRTRLTRLEEVMANCEERRLVSVKSHSLSGNLLFNASSSINSPPEADAESNMPSVLQEILRDPALCPQTLFRDLQYIATFVPSSILDHTPEGTAFWTFSLAAVSLKSDICKSLTHRANEIVAYHYEKPTTKNQIEPMAEPSNTHTSDTLQNSKSDHNSALQTTTLDDAARLYIISALEGDPTAARELALFYLMPPEGLPRVTLPLSRAGDVFRPQMVGRGGVAERQQGNGLDPHTFALAFHWMEFAANAGDVDAKTFLKNNGDLGRGW